MFTRHEVGIEVDEGSVVTVFCKAQEKDICDFDKAFKSSGRRFAQRHYYMY
jgi:hypothetical protein